MGKTEEKLAEVTNGMKFSDEQVAKRLEDSYKRFENLISRGLARPRGYTLMTSDNTHVASLRFNVPVTK